jgi:EAL domain-containing protein (putative c-di-GMP-specific phosphodiesterase class I)
MATHSGSNWRVNAASGGDARLPIERAELHSPQAGESSPVRQPAILLVDDDEHTLDIEMRVLRSMGYGQLTCVKSANDALLQLEYDSRSADIIICDLNMPGMDGIEFLQALNRSPFRGAVILLSAEPPRLMHSVHRLLGGKQLRLLGALTKPAPRAELRALIDSWRPHIEPTPAAASGFILTAEEFWIATAEQQWVIHYQPQVSLRTGAVVGIEALLRWDHPVHGLVYPDQFIALAEGYGVISDITDWVVHNALAERARWFATSVPVCVAVNLSLECFQVQNFWRRLDALVQESNTSPQDVTIEVTESRIAAFGPIALENLIRLRMKGYTLSIDDFGTGHSSLAQLRDVPFTELKIDRGFVSGARHSQIIRPILEGSLAIAARLGMISVAEGVETADDWRLLRELHCDCAQGYFIAQPMSGDKLVDWLSTWEQRFRRPDPGAQSLAAAGPYSSHSDDWGFPAGDADQQHEGRCGGFHSEAIHSRSAAIQARESSTLESPELVAGRPGCL